MGQETAINLCKHTPVYFSVTSLLCFHILSALLSVENILHFA